MKWRNDTINAHPFSVSTTVMKCHWIKCCWIWTCCFSCCYCSSAFFSDVKFFILRLTNFHFRVVICRSSAYALCNRFNFVCSVRYTLLVNRYFIIFGIYFYTIITQHQKSLNCPFSKKVGENKAKTTKFTCGLGIVVL